MPGTSLKAYDEHVEDTYDIAEEIPNSVFKIFTQALQGTH